MQEKQAFFLKIIDLSIEYAAHSHDKSLLMGVKSEWHIHKAKPHFSKKVRACCSMGCMMRTYFRGNWQSQGGVRSTTKNAHTQVITTNFFKKKKSFFIIRQNMPLCSHKIGVLRRCQVGNKSLPRISRIDTDKSEGEAPERGTIAALGGLGGLVSVRGNH